MAARTRDGMREVLDEYGRNLPTVRVTGTGLVKYQYKDLVPLATCPICDCIMVEPRVLDACEHVCCRRCIFEELHGERCPVLDNTGKPCGEYVMDAEVNSRKSKLVQDIVDAVVAAIDRHAALAAGPPPPLPAPAPAPVSPPIPSHSLGTGGAGTGHHTAAHTPALRPALESQRLPLASSSPTDGQPGLRARPPVPSQPDSGPAAHTGDGSLPGVGGGHSASPSYMPEPTRGSVAALAVPAALVAAQQDVQRLSDMLRAAQQLLAAAPDSPALHFQVQVLGGSLNSALHAYKSAEEAARSQTAFQSQTAVQDLRMLLQGMAAAQTGGQPPRQS